MISILLSVLIAAVCAVTLRYAVLEFRKDRIPVLTYHRIVSDADIARCKKDSYVVSKSTFAAQMKYLKDNGYTPIDFDDFLYFREHRGELPPRCVIITFDDGYENNYLNAFPALKQNGFKAVIYSVSDPDTDEFKGLELPERLMSPSQMKEMSDSGISIQGHTATHPHLKKLSNEAIIEELQTCRKTLEAATGRPVRHMAIPYGSYDARIFDLARRTGYKTLSVPGNGSINPDTDPFHIRRFSVHRGTSLEGLGKILASPSYAVINRLYASAHLSIRRLMGQEFEGKIKKICAAVGMDNPMRLFKLIAGLVLAAAALLLVRILV